MEQIGRNDPCPCGSGKKYKKCCLPNQQPASTDSAWQTIHEMHQKLVRKLMEFTANTYGKTGYDEAWEEFYLWENDGPFDPSSPLHPTFGPWMFYHWVPEASESDLEDVPFEITPAEAFIEANKKKLSDLELEDLEENLHRPFSFYDVLECQQGAWVKVQDLLTGERFTVIEKMGSKSMKAGDLLYSKVVTVRDIAMFDGMAEFVMPPQMKIHVIDERKIFQNKQGEITPEWLKECDAELREIFWEFHEALFNPLPPILTNTDGELMVPHTMTFAIDDILKTFEALHGLCFAESKKDILKRADYDKKGNLTSVEFPWLQKGNKKNAAWENTVLGHIRLEQKKMVVEVNSKERSKKFLTVLKKKMPKGWTLKSTDVENLKAKLREKKSSRPSKLVGPDETSADIMSHPNIKAHLSKMNAAHWESWPLIPLPALKGKTPVEAIKTSAGRAAVDALITQFERDSERKPMPGQTVETFKQLRERLGL